jgi:hypothetical protein
MTAPHAFLERLDAVGARLREHASSEVREGALTEPDRSSGERWEAGQVWAHLAEFVPYWLHEAATVIEHGGVEPVPFGRTKSDPERIAAIERDRRRERAALAARVDADIAALRSFLEGLDPFAWSARGLHPTLGEMDTTAIVDEFLVGHLEQHAEQLDGLAGR